MVLASLALVLAVPGAVAAVWMWAETDRYIATAGDSGLAGLGYLLPLVVGIPSGLGLAFALPALALWRRMPRTALGCGIAALMPIALLAALYLVEVIGSV
ncbi:hypothetical protein HNR19_002791 [Nocardioides thalensis]|uniref:Uncharacterized protein n=1 Tax=Nocardioides thalensis TaxID=1914755 RepID=A0A853C7B4_9ACTN|nr:hypothetical protein [Nocardioides thalensis]NYJ02093.1 hypothetical protein [Nocardioides thalensis]